MVVSRQLCFLNRSTDVQFNDLNGVVLLSVERDYKDGRSLDNLDPQSMLRKSYLGRFSAEEDA